MLSIKIQHICTNTLIHCLYNPSQNNSRLWLLIAAVFAAGLVTFTHPGLVLHPWQEVPSVYGDGGKNTFTYLYHILHGKGVWFTGMNYPYGEHITFTDGQPLLSVTLGWLGLRMEQALTVLWWLIAFSFFLGHIYIYKILVHFRVQPFLAMCFSGLIMAFTPQLFCIGGHYALSYACVIPMLFYWTIQYKETAKTRYAAYITLLGTLCSFLHPYFAAVVLIWIAAYSAGYFIFTKTGAAIKAKHLLPLAVCLVVLFGVMAVFIRLTDPFKDRPQNPYGVLANCTTGDKILTSSHSGLWQFIKANTSVPVPDGGSGNCYPGIAIIGIVVASLVRGIINKRKKRAEENITAQYSPIWLFITFSVLLLAMGVPFVYGLEWLLDYASFLRQFRTLDRFAWIFYYLITVYGVVTACRWFNRLLLAGKKAQAYSLVAVVLVLWGWEASGYIKYERAMLSRGYGNYNTLKGTNGNWNTFLRGHNFAAADFQAILMLRYFQVGSEKLWVGNDHCENEISTGAVAGLQLSLPLVDAMMSRTSWEVAKKQVKIAVGPYVHKPILDDIKSNKPFLLLWADGSNPDPDQRYLLSASNLIGSFLGYTAYACYPTRLKESDKQQTDSILTLATNLTIGDTCIKYAGPWYVNHFDSVKATTTLFGNCALPEIEQLETHLATIPIQLAADQQYEFSCWALLGTEDYSSPFFKLDMLDASSNLIYTADALTKESTDNNGMWFRALLYFNVPAYCKAIRIRLFNEPKHTYKMLDELMLRPADAVIISKSGRGLMVNNHLLK